VPRKIAVLSGIFGVAIAIALGVSALAGTSSTPEAAAAPVETELAPLPGESEEAMRERLDAEREAMLDREWPRHGLLTKTQIIVREAADPDSRIEGWLRIGAHIRLRGEPVTTPTCASGWYQIHPRGYACAGQGIDVTDAAPEAESTMAPDLESALPYGYWFVKEPIVPEWFQLPSRDDQRTAQVFVDRFVALRREDEARARRFRAGELPNEPTAPPEVARFLDYANFVASNGTEVRSSRRFVRTVRGTYVKEAQLESRTGSSFEGVVLGEGVSLPVAWAIRPAHPMILRESDGVSRVLDDDAIEPFERLSVVPWVRRQRVGDQSYHVVTTASGERYVREWFLSVAEAREAPAGVAADEPWVHVDLSSQTLVLYRGSTPIYATLVSSGLEGHETTEGEFRIRRKLVSDTMADPGSDLGDDAYRIEDVPWTQYFEGSIALHAAFWHSQFGTTHSHGCVNLAPRDAHYLFLHTWPSVPEGWHGVSTEGTGVEGSRVIVTR
jgi:lipoprotein-anchoring transpeptidase ErfK/SrfK